MKQFPLDIPGVLLLFPHFRAGFNNSQGLSPGSWPAPGSGLIPSVPPTQARGIPELGFDGVSRTGNISCMDT